ncbi:MAG: aldo/keto reductase [Magnetococcales bacterium]|nr:aldo/keto reductase [Magnetococcales bacterium]MBF0155950.1 aldo/keto reductase [Magnetococcales bacterium]
MKRREFIQASATVAAAVTLGSPLVGESQPRAEKARVQKYRPLGRTGIEMSDISFGGGKLPSASMVLRAVDRGINYFDTAPDYGPSEDLIGKALKSLDRQKVVIASKFCRTEPYPAHLPLGSKREDYIAAVEGSLKRLGTDYLDVVFVHAIGEKEDLEAEKRRLLDPNMLEAYAALKKAGKVKHLAVSSHGAFNLEKLMVEAVDSGHYDLVMMAFNFMKFPTLPAIIKQAAAKGVGVVAMKTLAGARESGVTEKTGPFEQAAFRWVLQHPEVSGLVVTFQTVDQLDQFLPASGSPFTQADRKELDRYAALHGTAYCRTGCGDCVSHCSEGVEIANILRYQMYFENYGDEKQAMVAYARLGHDASSCLDCADSACDRGCAYGLPVGEKLRAAHRTLSFAPFV